MSKITEIKYLRVSLKTLSGEDLVKRFPDIWVKNSDGYFIRKDRNFKGFTSAQERVRLALDDTYAEMEAKVNTHLKLGWVLHGGVVWNYLNKNCNCPPDELFQTMVKYEMPKTIDLLGLFDNKASSDSEK